MKKQEAKFQITAIAKRLNKSFLEIATTIVEQGAKPETQKVIEELIKEIKSK